jgi:hypothetical protein
MISDPIYYRFDEVNCSIVTIVEPADFILNIFALYSGRI